MEKREAKKKYMNEKRVSQKTNFSSNRTRNQITLFLLQMKENRIYSHACMQMQLEKLLRMDLKEREQIKKTVY